MENNFKSILRQEIIIWKHHAGQKPPSQAESHLYEPLYVLVPLKVAQLRKHIVLILFYLNKQIVSIG